MTKIVNSAESFAVESLAGLVLARPEILREVPGGVVRTVMPSQPEVAVIAGGGTGHLPAFAGWVGPGMAHAAVCGDIFASPAAGLVESVARAADMGRGVLLVYGNYTGDTISFRLAAERLRADGIDARTLAVTDDVASAATRRLRRGIAGDLVVVKAAGAAAAEGRDLDAVLEAARRANNETSTLGVAFDGCTLPGAETALFTVPRGEVAVGLGIHGEPGLRTEPLPDGDSIADLLLDGVLDALDGESLERVAVVVNGLGATAPEELYLLYRRIAARLDALHVRVVAPVVGNQVTSLGMAGASLTVTRLSDDLERLWLRPAHSAGFHREAGLGEAPYRELREPTAASDSAARPDVPGDVGSDAAQAARGVAVVLGRAEQAIRLSEPMLGDLDAVAGDGDHGIGMVRGVAAAREAAAREAASASNARAALRAAAAAWGSRAGGTSGALWEIMLAAAAEELPEERMPHDVDLRAAVEAGVASLMSVGGARPGDKTIVDAALPYLETLRSRPNDADAFDAAADAARLAAASTAGIRARTGRALKHGTRSVGTPDPGATSFAIVVSAALRSGGP